MSNSILEPPEQLFVVGYTWERGNASGGQRHVFFRADEAERHLHDMTTEGDYKLSNITVHILRDATWEPLAFKPALPGRVVRADV